MTKANRRWVIDVRYSTGLPGQYDRWRRLMPRQTFATEKAARGALQEYRDRNWSHLTSGQFRVR